MTKFDKSLLQHKFVQMYAEAEHIFENENADFVIFAHHKVGQLENVTYHKPLIVSSTRFEKINKRVGANCSVHAVCKEKR